MMSPIIIIKERKFCSALNAFMIPFAVEFKSLPVICTYFFLFQWLVFREYRKLAHSVVGTSSTQKQTSGGRQLERIKIAAPDF